MEFALNAKKNTILNYDKGLFTNPVNKAKSLGMAEEGFKKSESFFNKLLRIIKLPSANTPGSRPVFPPSGSFAAAKGRVYSGLSAKVLQTEHRQGRSSFSHSGNKNGRIKYVRMDNLS